MEKLNREKLRSLIISEINSAGDESQDDTIILSEDFTRSEKRELARIIRNEIARLFYDLFKKRSFWTK